MPEVARFQPTDGWVLVEPQLEEEVEPGIRRTEGGLFKVETERPRPVRGYVVSGEGFAYGAEVLFAKYGGVEIELDGQMFLLLRAESDIYGVLD